MPQKRTIPRVCRHCGADLLARPIDVRREGLALYCSIACRNVGYPGPLKDRFWAKVDASGGPDACWPWTGSLNSGGYGAAKAEGRAESSHRVAFFLTHGHWPTPLCRHTCEGRYPPGDITCRQCCNPAHLREGTPKSNAEDRTASGRGSVGDRSAFRLHPESALIGSRNHKAKLNESQAAEIRRRYQPATRGKWGSPPGSATALAKEYGVALPTILRILDGSGWRDHGDTT